MTDGPTRGLIIIIYSTCFLFTAFQATRHSKFLVHVPPSLLSLQHGLVTLDYQPSTGSPPPNTTFRMPHLPSSLAISNALPGTAYSVQLYYTNESSPFTHALVWENVSTSEPGSPTNFTLLSRGETTAELGWSPPSVGNYTGFQLALESIDDGAEPSSAIHTIHSPTSSFLLRNLTPGATYQASVHSLLHALESPDAAVLNFTTQPSSPGRFIVWYRNQTTMLVLWQPPYPLGVFDQYRVSIVPSDSSRSTMYVPKEGDPPGPVQAAFYGLMPGRAYTISVQTVSRGQLSAPAEAQYRTLPLAPRNLSVDLSSLGTTSFTVQWAAPEGPVEFDKYQVSLGIARSGGPLRQVFPRSHRPLMARFEHGLQPGHTYAVEAATLSANVASWPLTINVTTRPLPVQLVNMTSEEAGELWLSWLPNNESLQDSFLVKYHEEQDGVGSGDNVQTTDDTFIHLTTLLPGRNYSVAVSALSGGVESFPTITSIVTRPSPPVIELLEPDLGRGGLRLAWKSDVRSQQDGFLVTYRRNDTDQPSLNITTEKSQTWTLLPNLYPGATYHISIFATSYGRLSPPLTQTWAVMPPKAPMELQVVRANRTSMMLSWNKPQDSLVHSYIIRYRVKGQSNWQTDTRCESNATSCEIRDLIPGERYEIRLNSVSNKLESPDLVVEQIMYPISTYDIKVTLGSDQLTFEWHPPEGRVDHFLILYKAESKPTIEHSKQIPFNESHLLQQADDERGLDTKLVKVEIINLIPGELYHFQFYTVSYTRRTLAAGPGVPSSIRTIPLINSDLTVVVDQNETSVLRIRYTPTRNVVFDKYVFQLDNVDIPAIEKQSDDTDQLVIFSGLIPGHLYNISAWTVSGDHRSPPNQRQALLFPEPVREVEALKLTSRELKLAWKAPPGDRDLYKLEMVAAGGHLLENLTTQEHLHYTDLKPYHNYTFIITVLAGVNTSLLKQSHFLSRTFTTLEDVPGKITLFKTISLSPDKITLQWNLSTFEHNGVLTDINITYYFKDRVDYKRYKRFEPTVDVGTITHLVPGTLYVFEIRASTKVGAGPITYLEESTPIWEPPTPSEEIFPEEVAHTSTTITVRFRKNDFSSAHGPVIAYAVIVAEDPSLNSASSYLPSWAEIQGEPVWPPYQVSEPFYPFNRSFTKEFVIGNRQDCKTSRDRYCNGPLKPNTAYHIKIRAFTAPDKYADTIYSGSITTDPNQTMLIVSIAVPLSFVLLLPLLLLFFHRTRLSPFVKKAHAVKEEALSISEGPNSTSDIITSFPVKLCDFSTHYHLMSADSDFRFAEQFEMLKHVGRERSTSAADLSVNRTKNRFTNILPYDHSRVKLLPSDDDEGSDYINANYIPGYNSPREFIVTQGPLHSTRDDFWRMIWEQHCRAIVMLTRCIEKGREKCDHYWPYDTQPICYGDIQVVTLSESQYPNWTISEFRLSRGEQSRVIKHFHFTTWPDFGVPEPPQTLVQFVRAFRQWIPPDFRPILVHCSAGVGRSGTFIALDRLLQHIQDHDYVDILAIVHEMRRDRVGMVQNEQQYICIHQCLLAVLEGNEGAAEDRNEIHDNKGFDGCNSKGSGGKDNGGSNHYKELSSPPFLPDLVQR